MGTWDIPILIVAGALLFIAGFGFGAGPGWGTRPPVIRVTNRGGHRTVVLGIEGFCRLVRGWEWVAPDDGDGTVGITLRGVGGTTGMMLALAQVDREIETGTHHPIAQDKIAGLLRREPVSSAVPNEHVGENLRAIPPADIEPRFTPLNEACPVCQRPNAAREGHALTCPRVALEGVAE